MMLYHQLCRIIKVNRGKISRTKLIILPFKTVITDQRYSNNLPSTIIMMRVVWKNAHHVEENSMKKHLKNISRFARMFL